MRELVASTRKRKTIIPLTEPEAAHGGLTLEETRTRLDAAQGSYAKWGFDLETTPSSAALYEHLFRSTPIEWNRIGHFQVSLPRQQCASDC